MAKVRADLADVVEHLRGRRADQRLQQRRQHIEPRLALRPRLAFRLRLRLDLRLWLRPRLRAKSILHV
jgi:hypothetical protein